MPLLGPLAKVRMMITPVLHYSRKLGIEVPGKLFQYRLRDYSADGKVTLMSQGRFM